MQFPPFFASAIEWKASQIGVLVGGGVALLLLLLGIIKCALIMRRPTASKLCVSALLLFLVGAAIAVLAATVGTLSDAMSGDTRSTIGTVAAVILVASFLPLAVALLLGIVGLALYDKTRFSQGRAQAIWTLSLGGLGVFAFFGLMIFAMVKAVEGSGGNISTPTDTRSSVITKSEFNFSIAPSSRWVNMQPGTFNKVACLALRRTNPEMYLMVIGEQTSGTIDLATLTEVSKANLASASQVLEQRQELVTLNGRTFSHVTSRVRSDAANMVLHYEHWLASERGYAWQFVFWSASTNRDAPTTEARTVMETFRLLDPTKRGGGKGTITDVSRPDRGYATNLAGMGWNVWPDPKQLHALTDFSAQRINEGLLVLPVRFDQETPDMEALVRAMLLTLDFVYPSEGEYETQSWSPGKLGGGVELTTQRELEGDRFNYILRVVRGKQSGHLVAGWALDGKGDMALLRQSMDAITLSPPVGPAPPLTAAQRTAYGVVLNEVGLSFYMRKEFAQAAKWFQKGFEHAPNDANILENVGNALEQEEKYAAGRDLLAPHVSRFPKEFDLGLRYARLQVLGGDLDAGNTTFLSLIDRGFKNEEGFLSWMDLLVADEHYPQALKIAEAWVAKHPTVNARRWQASVLFLSGGQTEAVTVLEKLATEYPKDVRVAYDLGGYYNEVGESTKAAAIAEKLLADGKESPRALMMLGWSQMGRKWYRDAKTTFERAASKQPDDTDIQDAIRHASAMLGQGDNSSIREPLAMVAIPEQVASAVSSQDLPSDFGEGHSAAWLMRATGWHYEKDKPMRRTSHRRVKILTSEGARAFSSVELSFDPLAERVYMNRLEVKDADGKSVAKASIGDAYVRDFDDGTANHRKVLHMQVAGVQPGHVVEWEVTVEDRSNADIFEFQRYLFVNSLPSASEAVFVTGDVAAIKSVLAQGDGVKKVKGDKLIAWVSPLQLPAPEEPWSIWPERRSPMLWLGGDEGTWEKVAREYIGQIEDRLKPEPSVAELAVKLTAGLTTAAEKTAAIARYVQKEYGYKAIEFGVRARRPNAAAETVKLRYGDCKDLSLLMHQLLRAAGIENHLALVDSNWRLQLAMPSLDQFNHMVVHVPVLGEGWLVDATDKTLDLGQHRAGGLWHAHALVLDSAKPRLLPPPAVPAGSCEIASRRNITPSGKDWHVQETLTLQGYFGASMRDAFVGLSADDQAKRAQSLLASQGAAQLEDFRFENLDDPTRPAMLHFTYKVRNGIGAGRAAAVPALWEKDYLQTSFVKDRRTAFELVYPMHLTSDVTVELPATPAAESLQALKQEGQSDFCTWKLETRPQANPGGTSIGLRFEFTTKPGEHPADRYSATHDAWEAARSSWDRQVSWMAK